MTGIRYEKDGEEREFKVSTRDDTNLMLGANKSILTVFRSRFAKEEDTYQFWIKSGNNFFLDGKSYCGVSGVAFNYFERSELYSYEHLPRPTDKLIFDSRRTALCSSNNNLDCFAGDLWLMDMYSKSTGKGLKDFDVYAYIYDRTGDGVVHNKNIDILVSRRELSQGEINFGRNFTMIWSGMVASIKDGEIVSNDTPHKNTYYVVVENRKGEILEIFTTQTFGTRVGDLIGGYSEHFSDEINNSLVKDDILLRMK